MLQTHLKVNALRVMRATCLGREVSCWVEMGCFKMSPPKSTFDLNCPSGKLPAKPGVGPCLILPSSPMLSTSGSLKLTFALGELRKHGLKVKIQEQPFRVLALLLEQPGEIVAREELRKKLWPAETFVDFEHGLNAAINKLREALGDSADNPRFVETLHRRGYRFIAPVEAHPPPGPSSERREVGVESPPGSEGDQREVVVGAVREPPLGRRWVVALSAGRALLY